MRLTILLLMGLTLLIVACRTTRLDPLLKVHPYDTLDIYSYLVITLGPSVVDSHRMIPARNGTAFFYRRDKNLFLVTAYHVLTGCPFYDTSRTPERLDSIDVWYKDSLGRRRSQRLSLAAHKLKICSIASERGDIDTIDVSAYFKDARINSVEDFVCDPCGLESNLICKDTVVAHGFSNVDTMQNKYDSSTVPWKPDAYVCMGGHASKREWCTYMPVLYSYIRPKLHEGASGAPIFKIRSIGDAKLIEFIGIQSGSAKFRNASTVAKREELKRLLF